MMNRTELTRALLRLAYRQSTPPPILFQKAGVPKNTYRDFLRGKTMGMETLNKLMPVLGVRLGPEGLEWLS